MKILHQQNCSFSDRQTEKKLYKKWKPSEQQWLHFSLFPYPLWIRLDVLMQRIVIFLHTTIGWNIRQTHSLVSCRGCYRQGVYSHTAANGTWLKTKEAIQGFFQWRPCFIDTFYPVDSCILFSVLLATIANDEDNDENKSRTLWGEYVKSTDAGAKIFCKTRKTSISYRRKTLLESINRLIIWLVAFEGEDWIVFITLILYAYPNKSSEVQCLERI